jgi:hypothetical protein
VGAIRLDADLPPEWQPYVEINARYARAWPVLVQQRPALEGADALKGATGRIGWISPRPGRGG